MGVSGDRACSNSAMRHRACHAISRRSLVCGRRLSARPRSHEHRQSAHGRGPQAVALIGLAGSSATWPARGRGQSVLFIGNSVTYVIDHTNGATDAVDRIDGERWSYVVLQQPPLAACAGTRW
jgi:hypothetical protein